MESVMLTARVTWDSDHFLAKVDQLPLEGVGESVEEAQDQLIQTMRSWIEENREDTGFVLMCHHPFDAIAPRAKSSLGWIWREKTVSIMVHKKAVPARIMAKLVDARDATPSDVTATPASMRKRDRSPATGTRKQPASRASRTKR